MIYFWGTTIVIGVLPLLAVENIVGKAELCKVQDSAVVKASLLLLVENLANYFQPVNMGKALISTPIVVELIASYA